MVSDGGTVGAAHSTGADPGGVRLRTRVAVVGGGQAGLSMSFCLKDRGIEHVVFEKERIASEWRQRRWESFCLVTPNWQCRLPGFPYRGPDPQGFMNREEIVRYIEDYASSFAPPLLERTAVLSLCVDPSGGFSLATSIGECTADHVVVATGGYHVPTVPRCAERLPEAIVQLHSSEYSHPRHLPPGDVLVVGTGQSGCQIAEDLHLEGRQVHLSVGGAPRTARRYRGKDVVEWLDAMGYYAMPVHEHPLKERVRAKANHYVTGRGGGRDIDLRRFALEGMRLYGRLTDVRGGKLRFAPDLTQNLDQADTVAESIKRTIDKFIEEKRVEAPAEARYVPPWVPEREPEQIDLATSEIRSVIWSTGFRPDYRWVDLPVFDGRGYPSHRRGITPVSGLFFLGLPWLHTWGSGRFSGVGQDAAYLADHIRARLGDARAAPGGPLNELALGS
jgi:putative flavoprotein involved in K+ transport